MVFLEDSLETYHVSIMILFIWGGVNFGIFVKGLQFFISTILVELVITKVNLIQKEVLNVTGLHIMMGVMI